MSTDKSMPDLPILAGQLDEIQAFPVSTLPDHLFLRLSWIPVSMEYLESQVVLHELSPDSPTEQLLVLHMKDIERLIQLLQKLPPLP